MLKSFFLGHVQRSCHLSESSSSDVHTVSITLLVIVFFGVSAIARGLWRCCTCGSSANQSESRSPPRKPDPDGHLGDHPRRDHCLGHLALLRVAMLQTSTLDEELWDADESKDHSERVGRGLLLAFGPEASDSIDRHSAEWQDGQHKATCPVRMEPSEEEIATFKTLEQVVKRSGVQG